jgi:hypothetical protein
MVRGSLSRNIKRIQRCDKAEQEAEKIARDRLERESE